MGSTGRMVNVHAGTGANEYDKITQLHPGDTPLHICCDITKFSFDETLERLETIEYLLDQGADIDSENDRKETPSFLAARNNNPEMFRLLISRGANIHWRNTDGCTLLHIASYQGSCEIVDFLKEFHCDIEATDMWGLTSLHDTHIRTVPALAENGHGLDAKDKFGENVVAAMIRQSDELGMFALEQRPRFDSSVHPLYGSLLTVACEKGREHTAKHLLAMVPTEEAEEYVNYRSVLGTPLYIAAYRGDTEIVNTLLKVGTKIDLIGGEYGTALHAACRMGRTDVVLLLLDKGAQRDIISDDGSTFLALERAAQHPKVLAILQENKPDT